MHLFHPMLFIAFFFVNTVLGFGQINQQDREIDLNECTDDSCRIDQHNLMAWELRTTNKKEAKYHARKSIELCRKSYFPKRLATAFNRLGIVLKNEGDLDSAIYCYNEALKIETKQKHNFGIGRAYYQLSKAYKKKGDLKEALKFAQLNHDYMARSGDDKAISNTYTNLGILYSKLGKYGEASNYFFKALKGYRKIKSLRGQANVNQDLGNLYDMMLEYDLAEKHHREAFELYTELEDFDGISDQYVNLGNVFFAKGEYDQAEAFYQLGYDLKEELDDYVGLLGGAHNFSLILESKGEFKKAIQLQYELLKNVNPSKDRPEYFKVEYSLGVNYLASNQFDSAIVHLTLAYSLAKELDYQPDLMIVCQNLAKAHSEVGDFKKAFEYRTEAQSYDDTLQDEYRKVNSYKEKLLLSELENKKIRGKIKLKKSELKQAQLIAENRTIWIYAISAVSLALFVYIFFWIRNFRARQALKILTQEAEISRSNFEDKLKQSELTYRSNVIRVQEEERQRISEELHDNVGGMLSTIKLHFKAIDLEKKSLSDQANNIFLLARNQLDKVCEKVRVMSHEMSTIELEKVGLIAQLTELTETIRSSGSIAIQLNVHNMNDRFTVDFETDIYKTVRELITNSLRHGDASIIQVGLTRHNGDLNVMVEDNGSGFNPKRMIPGLGFTQISERLKKFGGTMNIDSGRGNGATISLDVAVKKYIR